MSVALAALATLSLTAAASATTEKPLPPGDGPVVSPLSCNHAHSNKDRATNRQFFDATNVNIRPGPHVGCTPSLGLGQLNHTVDLWCFTSGDTVNRDGTNYTTWTYIQDETTGVEGWVSDAYLDVNSQGSRGSLILC